MACFSRVFSFSGVVRMPKCSGKDNSSCIYKDPDVRGGRKCSKMLHFYSKYSIPGVIGCVDGTHIKIMAPSVEERHLYYNQKGFYSINAMILYNHNMCIMFVDARYPGANHDSFVRNGSNANTALNSMYSNGK